MQNGLLSVLMVNYNHAAFLREAIESVLAQTYQAWEVIFVDDGSADNSLAIIEEYRNKLPEKIQVITHPGNTNLGITTSYQLGISLCRGEYIGFLEPDDIWEKDNAAIKISFLKNNEIDFVYSDIQAIGDSATINMRRLTIESFSRVPAGIPFFALPELLVDNFVPSFSTVIARNKVFDNIKFISDKECAIWLDWFLWLQISLHMKFLFVPKELVRWRLYQRSYSNAFISRSGVKRRILFDLRYRFMIFKEIIFSGKISFWKKINLSFMFVRASVKKGFLFLYHRFRKI